MASFSSAFAAARKAGKSTFSWNGKSYNTKVASSGNGTPSKAPRPSARPAKLPDTVSVPASRPTAGRTGPTKPTQKARLPGGKEMPDMPMIKGEGPKPEKMGVLDKVKNSVRVGKTAVDRGHRRDDAKGHNKDSGAARKNMLKGMDKFKKKDRMS